MKTPICSFDAKTGVLCSKCESKLEAGHLTKGDVDASIKLTKLSEKDSSIDKFTLICAHKIDDEFVVTLAKSDISVIRSDIELSKKIKKEFNDIYFIESGATERRFIENLVHPIKIDTINLVWLPDGKKLTKITVSEAKNRNQKIENAKIIKIAKEIRDIELLIDYSK